MLSPQATRCCFHEQSGYQVFDPGSGSTMSLLTHSQGQRPGSLIIRESSNVLLMGTRQLPHSPRPELA